MDGNGQVASRRAPAARVSRRHRWGCGGDRRGRRRIGGHVGQCNCLGGARRACAGSCQACATAASAVSSAAACSGAAGGAPRNSRRGVQTALALAAADATLGSPDAVVTAGGVGGCGGGAGGMSPSSAATRPLCVVEVVVQKTRGKSFKWSRSHTPSPTG